MYPRRAWVRGKEKMNIEESAAFALAEHLKNEEELAASLMMED